MNEVWTVQFTMDEMPDEYTREYMQMHLDSLNIDGSVSAIPDRNQWTVSFGVEAESPHEALSEAYIYASKIDLAYSPVGIEIVSLAELERRADEPTMPQLVGASEVAEMLDVSRQRVHQLREHADFPVPLVEVAMGPLWDARAIDKFAREWARSPGRPRREATTAGRNRTATSKVALRSGARNASLAPVKRAPAAGKISRDPASPRKAAAKATPKSSKRERSLGR